MTKPRKPRKKKHKHLEWGVEVERLGVRTYRTEFYVGPQGFTLAYAENDKDAKIHCEFIKRMFLIALANLGIKP